MPINSANCKTESFSNVKETVASLFTFPSRNPNGITLPAIVFLFAVTAAVTAVVPGISALTVTLQLAFNPFAVSAVITALPAFFAVTVPFGETSAISAAEVLRETLLSEAFFGKTSAVSFSLPPAVNITIDRSYSYGSYTVKIKAYNGKGGNIVLPSEADFSGTVYKITEVGDAFKDNELITGVTIPEGYTDIGTEAFSGCVSLEKAEIPGSVSMISTSAFFGCTSLKEVIFADDTATSLRINMGAFANCSALTANDMEIDIATGLESGADDYITKPFSLAVLRARVNAVTRRKQNNTVFRYKNFAFDFENMKFSYDDTFVELSKTEQKLLKMLAQNMGRTTTRDVLIDGVWSDGAEFVEENALSVCVKRLRRKLPGIPVKTVYGIGYVWEKEK